MLVQFDVRCAGLGGLPPLFLQGGNHMAAHVKGLNDVTRVLTELKAIIGRLKNQHEQSIFFLLALSLLKAATPHTPIPCSPYRFPTTVPALLFSCTSSLFGLSLSLSLCLSLQLASPLFSFFLSCFSFLTSVLTLLNIFLFLPSSRNFSLFFLNVPQGPRSFGQSHRPFIVLGMRFSVSLHLLHLHLLLLLLLSGGRQS